MLDSTPWNDSFACEKACLRIPDPESDFAVWAESTSRNETLASLMRRFRICEERGSGIDKVVSQTELFQLPAPLFETVEEHTRIVPFAHHNLREMDKGDRIWACYLHACLRYVQRDFMTNSTLRDGSSSTSRTAPWPRGSSATPWRPGASAAMTIRRGAKRKSTFPGGLDAAYGFV